uniref:Uncharacterized protein n=1 Tax=Aegilops tauschii subsp. strangulata TaxID=200361 RepID=A0A452Y610_AEGTS
MCVPAKKSNSGPILLHLDSLGMHPTLEELMTAVVIFQIQQCILGTGWFAQGAVVFKIYHVLKCLNQRLMLCTERILRNFRRLKLKASLKTE